MEKGLEVILVENKKPETGRIYQLDVHGPERDDAWCAEPKYDAGYHTELQQIFFLQKMNECYLLTHQSYYGRPQPNIFDATTNLTNAKNKLYDAAKDYAKGLMRDGSTLTDAVELQSKKEDSDGK